MTEKSDNPLDRTDWWIDFLNTGLEKFITLGKEANPDAKISELKDLYFINKIASVCVSVELLKERIEELEKEKNIG